MRPPPVDVPPFAEWLRRRPEAGSRGDRAWQRIKARNGWTKALFVKQHGYLHRGMRRRRETRP